MVWRNEPRESIELVVLSLLAEGARHGYGILKEVAARSEGQVRLGPGVLYPLLKSLESGGLVAGSWETVRAEEGEGEGRRRKWYRLTPKGRKRLDQRLAAHRRYRALIDALTGRTGEEASS
ncbi:MAG: PadR family transcriptional regulator [Phycisphaerales bacterium]